MSTRVFGTEVGADFGTDFGTDFTATFDAFLMWILILFWVLSSLKS